MKKKHLLFLVLFMQALCFRSHAAKITVTNSEDNVVGGLRFAIANAAAGDTIGFAPSLFGGIISISPTVILINKNLTIIGPGADKLMLTNHRTNSLLIIVEDGVNVFMSGIKIEGSGDDEIPMQNDLSGAIYNKGNLTIEDAALNSNYIGAIYSTGVLNLNRVSFFGNYTKGNNYPGRCAGITSSGVSIIKNCFFDSNGSDGGSGNTGTLQNSGTMVVENTSVVNGWSQVSDYNIVAAISNTGTLQLINSTISNCRTSGKGYPGAGGIYNTGNLSLEYCTIAFNTMENINYPDVPFSHPDYYRHFKGSGVYNTGNLSLRGSIVAQNGDEDFYSPYRDSSPIEEGVDGYTTTLVNDLGYNFVGINNGLNLTATTNILGTSLKYLDPRLGPLQNNGGGTLTHALSEGSYCIDAGRSPAAVLLDQRGALRDKPDIGAFEYKGGPISFYTHYTYFPWEKPTVILMNFFSHEKPHLLVSHVPGYRKLKLGYDGYGLYHANKNVVAGGNTTLEITLKNFHKGTEWDKIQIRPNGSTVKPLSLKNYVDYTIDIDHLLGRPRTIKIPLSDFDPSIDFTQLIILEFPYSNNAGYFKLGIEKIVFTGGTTPFLWFGDTKVDNTFDGGGVGGQLIASKFNRSVSDLISKVEFFNGTEKIAETTTYAFSYIWENIQSGKYTITAIAHTTGGLVVRGAPITFTVPPRIQRESSLLESDLNEESVYPNPTADIITIRSLQSNANVTIRDINGSVQYQDNYSNLQNGQADISFLPAGLYFLKLEDEENPSGKVFKLIKQ